MNNLNQCPICDSSHVEPLFSFNNFPFFTVPLPKDGKKRVLEKYTEKQLSAPLHVKTCTQCYHSFLNSIPDQEILNFLYSNYYSYPSPLKEQFEPERDNHFLEFFQKNKETICNGDFSKHILEVGCFDGYILYHLQQQGFNVTGCDPSVGAEIGKTFGLNIQKEFFDPNNYLNNEIKFDIVISRHFIEHTINPNELILNLKSVLKNGGMLILETPNIQHFLEKGLLEVFSLQHITLFTSKSLEYLMNRSGLEVLLIEKTPDNLIVLARKSTPYKQISPNSFGNIINQFNRQVIKNKKRIEYVIKDFINKESSIAIWGAGGFGIAALILYDIPPEKIEFYIDSDHQKWGMEYLTNYIPIISPEEAKEKIPDLIIVASMYGNGILNATKNNGFNCPVLLLSPRILLHC